ncbi:hypothetical protein Barb4_01943 [Bacteroidales bacterium Barb4]|nr:hypothetical protein Barb4_01943 [Bacteroidales bacterium Barb4]
MILQALTQQIRFQAGEDAVEGIMGGNTIRRRDHFFQKPLAGIARQNHVFIIFTMAQTSLKICWQDVRKLVKTFFLHTKVLCGTWITVY